MKQSKLNTQSKRLEQPHYVLTTMPIEEMKKNITLLPLGRTVAFLCEVYLIYTQIQQQHF